MTGGYQVDVAAMEQAVKGINGVISVLGEMMWLGSHHASSGLTIVELNLDEGDCGDEALSDAMSGFCDRWRWGVRHLVQEGQAMAKTLQETAGTYKGVEDQLNDTFKRLVDTLVGNPMGTEDPTKKSWEQMGNDSLRPMNADAEMNTAEQGMKRAWDAATKDVEGVFHGEQRNFSPGDRS